MNKKRKEDTNVTGDRKIYVQWLHICGLNVEEERLTREGESVFQFDLSKCQSEEFVLTGQWESLNVLKLEHVMIKLSL